MIMKVVIPFAILSLITECVWCNPCTKEHSVDISSGIFLPDGSVVHRSIMYEDGQWYNEEEDGKLVFRGCPCVLGLCVWKCCDDKQMYLQTSCKTGIDKLEAFNPPVFKGKDEVNVTERPRYTIYMHSLKCTEQYVVDPSIDNEEFYIQENGTLMEVTHGRPQWILPSEYCVEMLTDNETQPARMVALVCIPEETIEDDSQALYISYAVGLLLSVPFLLATFLVYVFIPDLRNLHGMCLMAYCAGLIVAYVFLAYLKVHVGKIGVTVNACMIVAFIVYYAFQTSFFWLNVMCFDIWRTFSGHRGNSTTKRRDMRRFAVYGAYAWGVPLLLTACTAGMQYATLPPNIITPGFGDRRCWFSNWLSELVYFFTPVLVLVVCNVVLFLVTAYRIRSIKQETSILKGSKSTNKLKQDKQRYTLYLKLFVVMGVNWTVELISFVVGGSNWYWIVIDISNIMLGFFIFMIFVWKKKVRNLVSRSELVYFFTPVLVLVVCNVVLFLVTAYRIRSIKQETSILKGSKSTNKLKQDKQRYTLYLKLFVVMGVNWTVELISFVVGGSNWYWIVIDISNIMLGFFIFMIFVWKKKVRNLVSRRYRSFRGLTPASSDFRKSTTATSTAITDESRLSEDPSIRLKDLN